MLRAKAKDSKYRIDEHDEHDEQKIVSTELMNMMNKRQ